ncbi:MAG: hypothetical protein A2X94_03925 [Bdellovibrionales bacterium GWB1_55_8]|nr:MAG: hypothetical protein A2X94_03925 [Bdellovibrionales bacterium GWB1_55_8]
MRLLVVERTVVTSAFLVLATLASTQLIAAEVRGLECSSEELQLVHDLVRTLPPVYSRIAGDVALDEECRTSALSKDRVIHELTHALDERQGLSSHKSFRQINGWKRSKLLKLKADEEKSEGFYRASGSENPGEDLATSAEGYFLDPEFICRQPAMYAWFSVHVGPSLQSPSDCEELRHPLDPQAIKAVGYVLISATSSNVESRFGHAMLHFHDSDGDPLNDVIIQAAGNYPGQPVFSGFETEEEAAEKNKSVIEVSRMDVLMKGATGALDFVVQSIRYKTKWLETVVLDGRDIQEKILELSPEQLRLLIMMVNRDMQREGVHYRFFKNNCATYVAETMNKVFAAELARPAWSGVYTPVGVYKDLETVTARDLPIVEGDQSRLKRLLPKRVSLIRKLKKDPAFKGIRFLEKVKKAGSTVHKALTALDSLLERCQTLSRSRQLKASQKKAVQSLMYTYSFEPNLALKGHAMELYKQVARTCTATAEAALTSLP